MDTPVSPAQQPPVPAPPTKPRQAGLVVFLVSTVYIILLFPFAKLGGSWLDPHGLGFGFAAVGAFISGLLALPLVIGLTGYAVTRTWHQWRVITIIGIITTLPGIGLFFYDEIENNLKFSWPGQTVAPDVGIRLGQPLSGSPTATPVDLDTIFGTAHKEPGTQLYYSETLGVGFTHRSYTAEPDIVTEKANVISVNGQTIEVFTKDPAQTLEQAITSRFLVGYAPEDCFPKRYESTEQGVPGYVSAGISYPPSTNPDEPSWVNAGGCPLRYSESNGIQYFLMNTAVPGKFLFVRVGQESAASDGTARGATGGFNWTHSIRILK